MKTVMRTLLLVAALASAGGACAQQAPPLIVEEVDDAALRDLAVPSPFRIPAAALRGRIRYQVRLQGDRAWYWPETGEQHVSQRQGVVRITVCADCGREAPPSGSELALYSQPSAYVESGDPLIVALARRAHGGSVEHRMEHLVMAVRERLSGPVEYGPYRSAREAYDARRGDCTEFALLLAATARARGIPARVVAGVAYGSRFVGMPHAFGPHVWVQVWNGQRWKSFDAGLADFGAGHIAIAIGEGAPATLRGAMRTIAALRIDDAAALAPPARGTDSE